MKHDNILLGVMIGMTSTLSILTSISAQANDFEVFMPSYIAGSVIEGDALSGVSGAVGINLVAGDANQQVNAAAIAITPNGIARTGIGTRQKTALGQANAPDISVASIRDNAFANSSGILSINQISGVSNAQANGVSFAVGIEMITDTELSQSITGQATDLSISGQGNPGVRIADVELTAFENSRGIVQLNQTAGSGNATRNNFALRISAGAK